MGAGSVYIFSVTGCLQCNFHSASDSEFIRVFVFTISLMLLGLIIPEFGLFPHCI